MTNKNTLRPGDTYFGSAECSLEGVMRDAVVILRQPENDDYAALYYAAPHSQDYQHTRQIISAFVRQYAAKMGKGEDCRCEDLEAIVIGGDYQKNRNIKDRQIYVSNSSAAVKDDVVNALYDARVRNLKVPKQERRAIKHLNIKAGGDFEMTETIPEENRHDAVDEDDYLAAKMREQD